MIKYTFKTQYSTKIYIYILSFHVSYEYSHVKTKELNAIFHKIAIHTKKYIFSWNDRNIF